MTTSTWQPVLDGALAARAEETIDAIVAALEARDPETSAREAEGLAAEALLHVYLERHLPHARAHAKRAGRCLDAALDVTERSRMSMALHGGFTGIAFVVEHVTAVSGETETGDDGLEQADAELLSLLAREPWDGHYDLISGLVGVGVYALERLPKPRARRLLERVVDHLLALAQPSDGGTCWRTPRQLIPSSKRLAGVYNLGVSHGVPGIIGLLAGAHAHGVRAGAAAPVLASAVDWLLSQRLPEDSPSCFGYQADADLPRDPARAAWCYGDPGIAAALLGAARALGEPRWEEAALDVGRRAALRSDQTRQVIDGGLCHGAAGLGHLFNRLYQATGEELFAREGRACFERLLAMRKPGAGVAGYQAWFPREERRQGWEDNVSLLTGACGIALSLLAAVSTVEPAWDRLLLASLRPAPASPTRGAT